LSQHILLHSGTLKQASLVDWVPAWSHSQGFACEWDRDDDLGEVRNVGATICASVSGRGTLGATMRT
jgi:hypothetical protein